ncbi:exosortase F system-associated protein [Oscillatoria amoena NRMC-F 0135]|nr:exosortase F system-associated protein [Oscillatoria amoena NRMC-F 0135]
MELLNIGFKRIFLALLALVGLALFYGLQEFDFVDWQFRFNQSFGGAMVPGTEVNFIISRLIRFLANDLLCILLIYALFNNKRFVIFGFYVQLFGLVVLFPIYIYLTLNTASSAEYSALVPLYRLVMNPILMVLLIPAFYFQQKLKK